MPNRLFEQNLQLLKSRDPGLAVRMEAAGPPENFSFRPSRSGSMGLTHNGPPPKTIHSLYDPLQEAGRQIDLFHPAGTRNFIVLGFGLGYHALELVRRVSTGARLIILEKEAELFRLAMSCNDLSPLFKHPGVSIHVAVEQGQWKEALVEEKTRFGLEGFRTFIFRPLFESFSAYYRSLSETADQVFQESQIEFKTQAVLSRLICANIVDNFSHILKSPGIQPFHNRFSGLPAVVVAAGPSLDKNIGLLKGAVDRVLIVAVATALQPLLRNGIEPDFVVALDPDETMVHAFDPETPPHKTWLLYDPAVPAIIPGLFGERRIVVDSNIFLYQWISRLSGKKGGLGKIHSVAHSALQFAVHLGCDPVILIGQDLSFSQHRMHCSGSYFDDDHRDAVNQNLTLRALSRHKYQSYALSLIPQRDVFGNEAMTTVALENYKKIFAESIGAGRQTINATEGGLPIPGADHCCLREALARLNSENDRPAKGDIGIQPLPPEPGNKTLFPELDRQARRFDELLETFSGLKRSIVPPPHGLESIQVFVDEMESLRRELLKAPDTLQLLQGYAYREFMEWNQTSLEISRDMEKQSREEILREKFKRDRAFLEALMEGGNFLSAAFHKMARPVPA